MRICLYIYDPCESHIQPQMQICPFCMRQDCAQRISNLSHLKFNKKIFPFRKIKRFNVNSTVSTILYTVYIREESIFVLEIYTEKKEK